MSRVLVKNGHVVDPSQGLDEVMDIGLSNGNVVDSEVSLSSSDYDKTIDASNKLVLPGLIDLHTHLAEHITPNLGINADRYCLPQGTTTAVDAGSTGELTFDAFKKFIIDSTETRIYAFINAESLGMIEFPQAKSGEKWPDLITQNDEEYYDYFTNNERTLRAIKQNPDFVVGIKWAHHGPKSIKKAVDLARKANTTIMVENHHMPESLSLLRKGDVVTHIYHKYYNKLAGRIDGMTDENGSIHDEYYKAYKNGILFDLGHGGGSFSWEVAELAIRESLFPNVISTDLWKSNVDGPVFDLPTTMSKLMHLGMKLEDIVKAVTYTPATLLKRENEIGTLRPGSKGGLVIMDKMNCKVELVDSYGNGKKVESILVPNTIIYRDNIMHHS